MKKGKQSILVIFGGASPEYEVSCNSAASLIKAVSKEKYNLVTVGITKEGKWLLTNADADKINDAYSWLEEKDNKNAVLSPDRAHKGLLVLEDNSWSLIEIDGIFPIIHGETGEDGKLPALFELAGIPYVGAGVCASACSMDKTVTMIFSDLCSVKRPEFYSCSSSDFNVDPDKITDEVIAFFEKKLGFAFPVFVKPASTGSSIGISKVNNREELFKALELAASFNGNIIVEENIAGRELKVAVLGNENPITGDICEIILNKGTINSYELKYKSAGSHKVIPADLTEEKVAEIKRAAVDIYKKLDCKGFARVDFFLKDNGDVYFNEINTVPGFSKHSIYPLMFKSIGISYEELIEKLFATM